MQISLSSILPFKQNYDYNNKKSYNSYPYLTRLEADTISFGAKKNEFQGIDLIVVNKFNAPIQKFKTNDDMQNWCKKIIKNDYLNKDYTGRHIETTLQRK